MTFTYDLSNDTGKIRIHINDTDSTAPKFTDEEIAYALALGTTVGGAAVQCLIWLLAKLSDPNFTADWLTVDLASAFKSTEALLEVVQRQFGIPEIVAEAVFAYRPDSGQHSAPTFDGTDFDLDEDDD